MYKNFPIFEWAAQEMTIFHPKDKVKMRVLNPLGELLLQQGWKREELHDMGYGSDDTNEDEDDYYDESAASTIPTSSYQEVTTILADKISDMPSSGPTDLTSESSPTVSYLQELATLGEKMDLIVRENLTAQLSEFNLTLQDWTNSIYSRSEALALTEEDSTMTMSSGQELQWNNGTEGASEDHTHRFSGSVDNFHHLLSSDQFVPFLLLVASAILCMTSK